MSEEKILETNRLEKRIRSLFSESGIHIMRMTAPIAAKPQSIVEYGNKIYQTGKFLAAAEIGYFPGDSGDVFAAFTTAIFAGLTGLEKETNKLIAKMSPLSLISYFIKQNKKSEPDE